MTLLALHLHAKVSVRVMQDSLNVHLVIRLVLPSFKVGMRSCCCLCCCACPQPYSVARMQRLVAVALATCNAVYITVIICSGLVFGDALEADVLANINSAAMAPLIGPTAAVVTSSFVRVGYLLSLIGSYVLLCYPLRQVGSLGSNLGRGLGSS